MTPAIVVLGMHRSGTSCLAGMLAAAGVASAGETIRNWDNARGHHEMLDLVRLDEAVLAHSGAHYLAPPAELRWTAEHATARDRLLASAIAGLPPLLKDPRMLLALPFWRASSIPFRAIGIVRHPLAVARSLATWRELPLDGGIALWLAHNRALAADRAAHGTPVIDFEQSKEVVVAAVAAVFGGDPRVLAAAYDEQLVHHDDGDPPAIAGLDDALALYRQLGGQGGTRSRAFPRAEVATFERLLREGAREAAVDAARAAVDAARDPAAVLVPAVTALVRAHAYLEARALIDHAGGRAQREVDGAPVDASREVDGAPVDASREVDGAPVDASREVDAPGSIDRGELSDVIRGRALRETGLLDLLRGKVALALHDPSAVTHLEAACAVASPLYQARHLLPHALRAAGRPADARTALERVATDALYPHGPLATLAEWSFLDGDLPAALADMARAIDAAPLHRRGRLRTRRAVWLRDAGDLAAARAELERAIEEDPAYSRSRVLLASL